MLKRKRKRCLKTPLKELMTFVRRKNEKLYDSLKELDNLIGMESLKNRIVEQIQFIILNKGSIDDHFLNTVLQGDPGTGKTSVAHILFKIWSSLDIFDKKTELNILHRSDFVGSYMGHTSSKTKKLLERYAGGVIFIDEAYSLSSSNRDDYGKEALDQLNSFISEQNGKTIVIIAGYEKELEKHFFGVNPGLKRRFQWKFSIDKYNAEELYQIFKFQLKKYNWDVEDTKRLFEEYHDRFKYSGGDTLNIAFKAKLQYSKRNWKKQTIKKVLSYDDVKQAIQQHLVN